MISCLMVTQTGREKECRASIESFARQTFSATELIIVHDGTADFHRALSMIAAEHPGAKILIFAEPAGQSLGTLRNRSVVLAAYPYICQWDDDDLSHPARLACQFAHLKKTDSDFCFMTDQLHLFTAEKQLFWDDWSVESYPGNLIQGTILGRRDLLGIYPDLPRGEDTELVFRLVKEGHKIASLSDYGWMYIYTYNGRNAWSLDHHKAISRWKRLNYGSLKERLSLLEEKLRDYRLPYDKISMLHEKGKFEISLCIP